MARRRGRLDHQHLVGRGRAARADGAALRGRQGRPRGAHARLRARVRADGAREHDPLRHVPHRHRQGVGRPGRGRRDGAQAHRGRPHRRTATTSSAPRCISRPTRRRTARARRSASTAERPERRRRRRRTLTRMTDLANVLDRVDKIADVIRDHASESERLGHLAPPVVQALHDADLFRVLVPTELGGPGLTIPEAIEVMERVAEQDASTGWAYAILGASPVFARFLPPATFATLYGGELGLAAGSLNPVATQAEVVDGGYRFTGRGTYLSGSAHAQWIAVAGIVMKDGAPSRRRRHRDPRRTPADRSGAIARHVARHRHARHRQHRLRVHRRVRRDRLHVRAVPAAGGRSG